MSLSDATDLSSAPTPHGTATSNAGMSGGATSTAGVTAGDDTGALLQAVCSVVQEELRTALTQPGTTQGSAATTPAQDGGSASGTQPTGPSTRKHSGKFTAVVRVFGQSADGSQGA